jgi:hypothetical protein
MKGLMKLPRQQSEWQLIPYLRASAPIAGMLSNIPNAYSGALPTRATVFESIAFFI